MRHGPTCLLVGLALQLFRGTHALPNGLGKLQEVTATGTTLKTHDHMHDVQHLEPNAMMASCSPQKACDFVKQLAIAVPHGPFGPDPEDPPISLLCEPEEDCTISGTTLGPWMGIGSLVEMAHVLIQNNTAVPQKWLRAGGGLLEIVEGGSVTGTNLTFRNGHSPK